MDLTPEITKAIEAKLPELVGDIVMKRLNALHKAEETIAHLRIERDDFMERAKEYGAQIDRQRSLESRESALKKREQECAFMETRIAHAEQRVRDINELAKAAFEK